MHVPLIDHAALPEPERQALEQAISGLTTLERVLTWARSLQPPARVDEILTQDEYTHDVLLPVAEGRYLNFDTT